MNVDTRGMLIGMVLGDGHLWVGERISRGYTVRKNELRVLHSTTQRAYCEHKAELIRKAFGRKFRVTEIANGPYRQYRAVHFSFSHSYLRVLKSWMYPNGKKTYTRKVLDMLTPLGIAIWYMDDGHARKNVTSDGWIKSVSTNIATMCSEEEAQIIVDFFQDEYAVPFKVRCDKRCKTGHKFFVETNTKGSHDFIGIIEPHVPECMRYKLAHVADLNLHERQKPLGTCVQCGEPYYRQQVGYCSACYAYYYYHRDS